MVTSCGLAADAVGCLRIHNRRAMSKKYYYQVLLLAAACTLFQVFYIGLTNDTDMLMHTASHMQYEGGLYSRWIAVNSPVIYYLYAVAVMLSMHFKIPPAVCLHGMTAAFCLLSIYMTRNALRAHAVKEGAQRLWIVAVTVALLVAPSVFHVFADREHYLFIFAMPWLLQMLLRLPAHPLSTAFALPGLFLKPYNMLLVPALVFCGGPQQWSWKQRLFSPSMIIAAIAGIAYLAFLSLVHPDYFGTILPLARTAYGQDGEDVFTRLARAEICLVIAGILIAALKPPMSRVAFTAFTLAAALIYCLNMGWLYTGYILCVPAVLLCPAIWISAYAASRNPDEIRESLRVTLCHTMCFALFAASTFNLQRDIRYTYKNGTAFGYNDMPNEFKDELRGMAGENFVLLSVNIWSSAIAALRGAPHSAYAYDDAQWPYPWVEAHPDSPRREYVVQTALVKPFLAALQQRPSPALIIDDSRGQVGNLFALLQKDKAVQEALKSYRVTQVIDHCGSDEKKAECRFSIWKAK